LSYSYFQNLIRTFSSSPSSTRSPQLTIPQLGLAAAGAGFVTSFILFVKYCSRWIPTNVAYTALP
jgi:ornithine carrier protein